MDEAVTVAISSGEDAERPPTSNTLNGHILVLII